MRKELEDRLVTFAVSIMELCKNLEKSQVAEQLSGQIWRSVTSAALNYGEAQGAESKKDFTHKIGIVLKELRETNINLQILVKTGLCNSDKKEIQKIMDESSQLVAIFHKTAITSKKNP